MEKNIKKFLELRLNYLNSLKVESNKTYLSEKYMFLFGVILSKESHNQENCYQIKLESLDNCENLIDLLNVRDSERLMSTFKKYESKEKFPFYVKLCFRKQDALNGYVI